MSAYSIFNIVLTSTIVTKSITNFKCLFRLLLNCSVGFVKISVTHFLCSVDNSLLIHCAGERDVAYCFLFSSSNVIHNWLVITLVGTVFVDDIKYVLPIFWLLSKTHLT